MEEKEKMKWEAVERDIAKQLASQNTSFATEVVAQAKANARRWFIAFLLMTIAFTATNAYWIYQFNSYGYVYQDGNGQNNYNNQIGGDTENVTSD